MAAYMEIAIWGRQRRMERLRAVVDTGFDGAVCLPVSIAVNLGLELVGREFVEYADGRVVRELLFRGKVQFLGEVREVNISLTNADEALVGLEMLRGYRMLLDGDTHEVTFERKAKEF